MGGVSFALGSRCKNVPIPTPGLAFSAGNLAGDVYANSALLALADVPACALCQLTVDRAGPRCGRRGSLIAFLAVSGGALVALSGP